MTKLSKEASEIQKLSKQELRRWEKERDILLMLEHLAEREEATVKIILNCLYDIGSANIINQRFRSRTFKEVISAIAKFSQPTFRVIALYWFKRNCPQLITNWLISQVAFAPKTKAIDVATQTQAEKAQAQAEIQQLRSKVKLLTGTLVALVSFCSVSFIWLFHSFQSESAMTSETTPVPNQLMSE